jgi:hypothetical protein
VQISTTLGSRPARHPGAWLVAKAALALVAILLMSLTVTALEMRLDSFLPTLFRLSTC